MNNIFSAEKQTSCMQSLIFSDIKKSNKDAIPTPDDLLARSRYEYSNPYSIIARHKSRQYHLNHKTEYSTPDEYLARKHQQRARSFIPEKMYNTQLVFNKTSKPYLHQVPKTNKNDLHINLYARRAPDNLVDKLERSMYKTEPEVIAYPIQRSVAEQGIQKEIKDLLFN